MSHEFVAHVRKSDKVEQSVFAHLSAVAALSKTLAAKLNTGPAGELIGLVHDLGKYSQCFQKYLLSAVGNLNPDIDDDFVNFKEFKGKIDHSTAGSQWIWQEYSNSGQVQRIVAQVLSLCVASHHLGCSISSSRKKCCAKFASGDQTCHIGRLQYEQSTPSSVLVRHDDVLRP